MAEDEEEAFGEEAPEDAPDAGEASPEEGLGADEAVAVEEFDAAGHAGDGAGGEPSELAGGDSGGGEAGEGDDGAAGGEEAGFGEEAAVAEGSGGAEGDGEQGEPGEEAPAYGEGGDAPAADEEERVERLPTQAGEAPEPWNEAGEDEHEEREEEDEDGAADSDSHAAPADDDDSPHDRQGSDGRPTSAELAALDDDEDEEEEDPVDETANRMQELQDKYDQLLELNERALQHNVALQRRVIQRRAQDKSYDAPDKQSEGKVTEHKYQNVLHNVHTVRLQLRLQQVKAARMSEELKNQLETKRQKAIECRDSFQEFKRQVARHAEYARTGKKIQEKIIQEVEEFELDKDAEVEEVRGSNISLKNRLAKLEQALRKKDELAENLHVIDFEQLKIENQTLNEKIEERNEELHKLRKKTVTTVQIITHMREKVQFVQQEYQALKAELAQLDQDLAAQRDLVAKTKHERDEHRSDSGKLKQQTSIMNSEHLTRDYETRAEHIKSLKDEINKLKTRHGEMAKFVQVHGGTI